MKLSTLLLLGAFATEASAEACAGCCTDFTEVSATMETDEPAEYAQLLAFKDPTQTKTGDTFGTFTPTKYKTQVVNGVKYIVVYNIGGENLLEVTAVVGFDESVEILSTAPYTTEAGAGDELANAINEAFGGVAEAALLTGMGQIADAKEYYGSADRGYTQCTAAAEEGGDKTCAAVDGKEQSCGEYRVVESALGLMEGEATKT